jgi:hypothetical protein
VSRMKDGKLKHRLVWDASRHLNLHLQKQKVKLAHLEKALELTEEKDLQMVFDLKSAYYNIKINESQWKYLGACIEREDGSNLYFRYKHLPFGLASAVHAITKLWKPIIAYLNKEGIRFSIYIDDGRFLAKSEEEARRNMEVVYNAVQQSGWLLENEKSDRQGQWNMRKEYLGFIVDSETMRVFAREDKLKRMEDLLEETLRMEELHVKAFAQVLGKMISLGPSHGGITNVCSKTGYRILEETVQNFGWSKGRVRMIEETKRELNFFKENLSYFNGIKIQTQLHSVRVEHIFGEPILRKEVIPNFDPMSGVIVSDASDRKIFAYDLCNNCEEVLQVNLTPEEQKLASGHRELLSVLRTLQTWNKKKARYGARIFWITDSENVTSFLKKGSSKKHIQIVVFEIFVLMRKTDIFILPIHLRREDPRIQLADNGSKQKDSDNWSIDEWTFEKIKREYGLEFDLFASVSNRRLPRFASLYYEEGTEGVDAFSLNWSELGMLWICPPCSALIQVARRIKNTKGIKGLIIMPDWPTAAFMHFYKNEFFELVQRLRPYIIQNEEARGTPLFGKVNFDMLLFYFET